jgi:hypothetical protein
MAHEEMEDELLKWAVQSAFCLNPTSMPANIVITPLRIAETFPYFPATLEANMVTFKKAGSCYLVWNNSQPVLFYEGGLGASNFGDSSFVLPCRNIEEIVVRWDWWLNREKC